MKRFICAILAIVLLSLVFGEFSLAISETVKEKVTFRDIPWGSSFEQTKNKLKNELGVEFRDKHDVPPAVVRFGDFGYYDYKHEDNVYYYHEYCHNNHIDVAGYEAMALSLFFLPEYSIQTGEISKNEGKLIEADYWIPESVSKKRTKEIVEKLDKLYGEHEVISSREIHGEDICRWIVDDIYIEVIPVPVADYYEMIIAYSDHSDDVTNSFKELEDLKHQLELEKKKKEIEEKERQEKEREQDFNGL